MSKTNSPEIPETCILIARVSGLGQEQNSSIESQLMREREYAHNRNYRIAAELVEIVSGVYLHNRTAFQTALDAGRRGEASVIVYDIGDRAGRGDTVAKMDLLAEQAGMRIEYAQKSGDLTTVEGITLSMANNLVSGIERLNIRRRLIGGKYAWAAKGRVIANSQRPYGYHYKRTFDQFGRLTDCVLEFATEVAARIAVEPWMSWVNPDEEGRANVTEPDVYLCIWYLAAALKTSSHGIASWLNEHNIPTKRGAPFWTSSTVWKILRATTYYGEWYYGKHKVKKLDTPDGIKIKHLGYDNKGGIMVPVPALVTQEQWQLAQDAMKANSDKFHRPAKREFLLSGRVRCAKCGGKLGGRVNAQGKAYYVCNQSVKYHSGEMCTNRGLRADKIEPDAWALVSGLLLDENHLTREIKDAQGEQAKARGAIEKALMLRQAELADIDAALKRWEKAYDEGDISIEKWRELTRAKTTRRAEAESEIRVMEQQIALMRVQLDENYAEQVEALRKEIALRLRGNMTLAEKRELLAILNVQCTWDSETKEFVVSGAMGGMKLRSMPLYSQQLNPGIEIAGFYRVIKVQLDPRFNHKRGYGKTVASQNRLI